MCVYGGVVFPFNVIMSNPNAVLIHVTVPLFFRNMNFLDLDALTAFISVFLFPIFLSFRFNPFLPE
jgi:hypothetical protein